jgi:PAS domain S-box-containing protein
MKSTTRRGLLAASGVLYSVLVFSLDALTPVGVEVWVLNLPLIVLPVFFRSARLVVLLSLLCSAMVVLGDVLSAPGSNPPAWSVLNRGMGLAALWVLAGMALTVIKRSAQLDDALGRLRREAAEHRLTGRALARSEERLRLATEGAGMGTFDVDLKNGKVVWSASHLRMLGFEATSDHETTIDVWSACTHPDDRARVREARELALRSRSTYSLEFRVNRADNREVLWLAAFGRHLYDEAGEAVRLLGVAFDVTRRKELERDAVQREVLEIAAREQRQIGQELHDGVGQELTGLGLMAQSLAQRLPEAAAEKRVALRLLAGLDRVHQQVRVLSRGLIPVHVESRGLVAALDDLAAQTAEASGVSVTAECPEWVGLPDHATATQLFRIAQEAVSNAVRHGRPRHIRISLLAEPNGLRLRIKDDGVGMRAGPEQGAGLGLRIMQYRAGQVGGDLQIGPAHGGGTVVSCTLPRSSVNDEKEPGRCPRQGEGLDRG